MVDVGYAGWGQNFYGELGYDAASIPSTVANLPVAMNQTGPLNGLTIDKLYCGGQHAMVQAANRLYAWGGNYAGQVRASISHRAAE